MNSLRHHRVLVASLFLPTTVARVESQPPTPEHNEPDPDPDPRPTLTHQRSHSAQPLKSIVDDLKSRTITPVVSPPPESPNPFATFVNIASPPPGVTPPLATAVSGSVSHSSDSTANPSSPPPALDRSFTLVRAGKFQSALKDVQHSARLQRNYSRSSSRRPTSLARTGNADLDCGSHLWHFSPNSHCNGGLKNALDSVKERVSLKAWVGTLGCNTDNLSPATRRNVDRRMKETCDSIPVWIPDTEFESCYDEFCHQVLWPCLHYAIPDAPKTKFFYETATFKQYKAVNQRFADAIIENYREGDIIWVNDYHLMLLPALLRSHPKTSQAPIGFFLHVAFPSSEIFRCLSVRESLLKGILGADLVGFQTVNYARHFRQTVSRILAYEALPKGIQVEGPVAPSSMGGSDDQGERGRLPGESEAKVGRFVDVGVFPMGIDVRTLREKKEQPDVQYWVQLLRQRYRGMKLIVGRDKLDEIQGVRHKIEAFERFLRTYPEFQGKVVLIQVALQTTESNELAGGVSDVVARVNAAFSTLTYQPLVFLHVQEVTFSQYLALLTVADAFAVTSLREGMALRTHEYVECQEQTKRPLILSEFTGSYSYSGFRSCITVNPYDTRGMAKAFHQALTMPDDEAASRWQDLHSHVVTQTAQAFATSFLTRCLRAHVEHTSLAIESSLVPSLDLARLIPKYRHSPSRLILLDFEGCVWVRDMSKQAIVQMVQEGKGPMVEPTEEAIKVLERLTEDVRNEVWVLSGLPIKGALEKVAERVPRVGIVAENGCFIKVREIGSKKGGVGEFVDGHANGYTTNDSNGHTNGVSKAKWINMVANLDLAWKVPCVEILNYFTERTPGSFVEERAASIVWRFWTGPSDSTPFATGTTDGQSADTTSGTFTPMITCSCSPIASGPSSSSSPQRQQQRSWANRQAAEAQNHIFDSLGERYGLRIMPGQNSFLVLPNHVSRSTAVGTILQPGAAAGRGLGVGGGGGGVGMMASMGHGRASVAAAGEPSFVLAVGGDERLLRRLNELDDAETVSTSRKGTDAKWKLEPKEVLGVLETFAGVP